MSIDTSKNESALYHIGCRPGEVGRYVLLPGDPYRAKWAAEAFLENPILVNEVRGMLGYTGKWKDNKVTIFKTKDGPAVDVQINNETAWLNQNQMTDLFEKDQSVISRHLNNIFKEKELDKKSNMQKMHIPNSDKPVNFYSLDVIISVGYRVKSKRGTQFRIWANKILKEFLLEGYDVNQNKLKGQSQKIKQLETTIKSIVEASNQKELSNTEANGILNLIQDYTLALDLLDDYDHQRLSLSQTQKSEKRMITYE